MAEVKWIKIAVDIFSDEKILLIEAMPEADSIIVIWFKLLMLAGKQNNHGVIMMSDRLAFTDEMLASIFRRPLATVRLALGVFEQFGMIEIYEDVITIPNWEKHQNLEKLEHEKELNRERVKRYREKQKALASGNDYVMITDHYSNDTDIDKDKNKNKNKVIKARNQIPPTIEMVEDYINENGYNVDAHAFIDYYESKGWMVGKAKMKDWQATVRNWNRNDYNKTSSNPFAEMLRKGEF